MARVTIEDCLVHVPSRFALTMIAAKRARQLARGAEAKLPWHNHKSTVLALQEISAGRIDASILGEADLPVIESPRLDFIPIDS
jgi:DNA-directed RNA polymerase subunit omega